MSKIYEAEPKMASMGLLLRVTLDPYLLMLSLGGLSHMLNKPFLAVNFWVCVLACIAVQSISPSIVTAWKLKDKS